MGPELVIRDILSLEKTPDWHLHVLDAFGAAHKESGRRTAPLMFVRRTQRKGSRVVRLPNNSERSVEKKGKENKGGRETSCRDAGRTWASWNLHGPPHFLIFHALLATLSVLSRAHTKSRVWVERNDDDSP